MARYFLLIRRYWLSWLPERRQQPVLPAQLETSRETERRGKGAGRRGYPPAAELGNEVWPGPAARPFRLSSTTKRRLPAQLRGRPPNWAPPRSGEQQGTAGPAPGSSRRTVLPAAAGRRRRCRRSACLGDQWARVDDHPEWSRVRLAQLMKEELPSWLSPVVPFFS